MSGKIKTITIELDDGPVVKGESPPFRGGLPLKLELEEPGNVDATQTSFLESLLKSHPIASTSFSLRFSYDLDGTYHHHGKFFVIDVLAGECVLRLATASDHDGFMDRRDRRDYRDVLAANQVVHDPTARTYRVVLESSWRDLTARDLKIALDMFRAAEVMLG